MIPAGSRGWRPTPTTGILALLVVVSGVLAWVGVSLWPLIICGVLPWALALAAKRGLAVSIPVTAIGSVWLLFALMVATPPTGLGLIPLVIVAWVALGVGGAVVFGLPGHTLRRPSRVELVLWLPPLLGPVTWAVAGLASLFVAGASHYSWAMTGDSANNLLFARQILDREGILIGPNENPVPLPAAFIALGIGVGRASIPGSSLLRHDVGGFVVIWAILIAATCYLAGLAASRAVRYRPWIAGAVGAAVSLVPLSWFVTGYPLEFGFFNAHLVLPLVFACWIIVLAARRAPLAVFTSLLLASTLMLVIWSPLVLIPLAFALYVGISHWRKFVAARRLRLVGLVAALLQLALYTGFATLPGLFAQGAALSAQGGIYPFSKLIIIAVFAAGTIAAVAAFGRRQFAAAWSLTALLVASAFGLAALLYLSRNQPTLWTYYPVKFAWLTAVIGLVIIPSVLLGALTNAIRNRLVVVALMLVLGVGIVFALNWAPRAVPSYAWMNPIERIFAGKFLGDGDVMAKQIFALSDPSRPSLLWQTGDPNESTVDFWLLQMRAGLTDKNHKLRVYAYGNYDIKKVSDLCSIVELMGGDVTVHTANANLGAQLAAACASTNVRVALSTTASR